MAVVTHGSSLPDSSQKTDFYSIVDNATVTSIVAADISASAAIQDTQLNTISTAGKVNTSALTGQIANSNLAQLTTAALVSGAALTLLPSIPSGAGIIPAANIGAILGSWTSKSIGQIYQAATDGFCIAYQPTGQGVSITGYTDSSSNPSTIRQEGGGSSSSAYSLSFPVKKNDYFEVTVGSASTAFAFFISSGS